MLILFPKDFLHFVRRFIFDREDSSIEFPASTSLSHGCQWEMWIIASLFKVLVQYSSCLLCWTLSKTWFYCKYIMFYFESGFRLFVCLVSLLTVEKQDGVLDHWDTTTLCIIEISVALCYIFYRNCPLFISKQHLQATLVFPDTLPWPPGYWQDKTRQSVL